MASDCSFAYAVSPLPAHRPPLAVTTCRLRHGAARAVARHRAMAAARPVLVGAARRMLGSVRHGSAGRRRCADEAEVAAAVGARARRPRAAAGRPPLSRRQVGISRIAWLKLKQLLSK
ncbi:hypothetical protein ZWY2020_014127 [Hordeum vulgare]|nr:hypothetical protein ZWY2020_014127 [Hordeum vulgare]